LYLHVPLTRPPLPKDPGEGRAGIFASIGGKLESAYFALGDNDVYILCECPDHVSAAALSLAVSASGLVHTKTIPLLTVEEADRALNMKTGYRAPGAGKAAKAAKA
jgi:hypothetical protein